MKAILVIDIPDFVNSITKGVLKPIGTVGKLEIGYGSDDGEMVRFEFINTERALLKPIPQRKQSLITVLGDGVMFNEPTEFEQGYNACIDEILGGK